MLFTHTHTHGKGWRQSRQCPTNILLRVDWPSIKFVNLTYIFLWCVWMVDLCLLQYRFYIGIPVQHFDLFLTFDSVTLEIWWLFAGLPLCLASWFDLFIFFTKAGKPGKKARKPGKPGKCESRKSRCHKNNRRLYTIHVLEKGTKSYTWKEKSEYEYIWYMCMQHAAF